MNQDLQNYIKQSKEQGMSDEKIKQELLKAGWLEYDINQVLAPLTPEVLEMPKLYSRKWILSIIIIIGIAIIIGGIYFVSQKIIKPTELSEEVQLDLDIIVSKDTYEVGEKFIGGEYRMQYKGDKFKGIILYGKYREGFENKIAYDKSVKTIETGDSKLQQLTAFRMDKTGFENTGIMINGKDFFQEAGNYMFTMSVFKCSDIGLQDEECLADISNEFVLKFQPFNSISKTITVIAIEEDISKEIIFIPDVLDVQRESVEKTVLDCDIEKDPYCTLDFLDIFKKNLQSCKPSKGTTVIGFEPAIGIFREYEIIGVKNGLCVVNFSFLEAENIVSVSLLNKEMTCKYSDFERTIEKVATSENCTGLLYDAVRNLDELMSQ
ncbi:MAG: hypothetical protein ABH887_00840 [bacterium]